ncbi:hypothetical protein ACRS64_26980 [Pseudomonas aeruginosa]|uniref:hypothetical protein n=1 Tax=Pseudomonas aeruginosa TaxID=287 RepID=UPI003DA794F8
MAATSRKVGGMPTTIRRGTRSRSCQVAAQLWNQGLRAEHEDRQVEHADLAIAASSAKEVGETVVDASGRR